MTDSPLRVRSFAKINLALSVLGRRTDGYHDIQTILQAVSLRDEIEFKAAPQLELVCEDFANVPKEQNLVWKAAQRLASASSVNRGVSITLRKVIPAGAGLGGGSSNAAATLLALRRFWELEIPDPALLSIAETLGSDVPFFLTGGMALGFGRGEKIRPLPDAPAQHVAIIFPGIEVSTAKAYHALSLGLTSSRQDHRIQRLIGQVESGESFLTAIFNDFEASVLAAHPRIEEAKSFLERRGATAVMLSGSGSSVFGFFSDEESAFAVSREVPRETWRVFPAKTLSRAEYFQNMFG